MRKPATLAVKWPEPAQHALIPVSAASRAAARLPDATILAGQLAARSTEVCDHQPCCLRAGLTQLY